MLVKHTTELPAGSDESGNVSEGRKEVKTGVLNVLMKPQRIEN